MLPSLPPLGKDPQTPMEPLPFEVLDPAMAADQHFGRRMTLYMWRIYNIVIKNFQILAKAGRWWPRQKGRFHGGFTSHCSHQCPWRETIKYSPKQ
ncbi:hypothetical protein PoB_005029500 [Plakobranchus ocellatus]|uniref:Uncharacterized protein n=1 Tax=Plakobranchus ocellatus TaxID=259542 RepID=A0AAV4BXB4_9GAST|nr:hypothetical protein PoB_005029500 [Plakobranchus ocellatus]